MSLMTGWCSKWGYKGRATVRPYAEWGLFSTEKVPGGGNKKFQIELILRNYHREHDSGGAYQGQGSGSRTEGLTCGKGNYGTKTS